MHAVAYVLFISLFTIWLGKELKRSYQLTQYWPLIVAAVISNAIGVQIFSINQDLFGNFVQHMSGGVSCVLLFIYLLKTLRLDFNWRLATVLIFAFVSTLGVMNELAEYAFELMGHSALSVDSHDTWRDFVANTSGAAIAWLLYGAYYRMVAMKRPHKKP